MNAMKKVFVQSMMISNGILFLNGILAIVRHACVGGSDIVLLWYHPMTIILTGIFCALPTLLLQNTEQLDRKAFWLRLILHCMTLYAAVICAGWLFRWYTTLEEYISVSIVFFLVYAFVWISTLWLDKQDERKINQALEGIRDQE